MGLGILSLAGLARYQLLSEASLAKCPSRNLGLPRGLYAVGAALVTLYALLMVLLGGIGGVAVSFVLQIMPFMLIGLMIGKTMYDRDNLTRLGLITTHPRHDIVWSLGGAILALVFSAALSGSINLIIEALGQTPPDIVHESLKKLHEQGIAKMLVPLIISAVILAPLLEELLYRGMLQTSLLHLLGNRRWPAIAIASGIFAITHWWAVHWQGLLPLFAVGLVFGYVYERTGSLLAPILTHALFNAVNIAIAVVLMSGEAS